MSTAKHPGVKRQLWEPCVDKQATCLVETHRYLNKRNRIPPVANGNNGVGKAMMRERTMRVEGPLGA